jgi:hypothetical protein
MLWHCEWCFPCGNPLLLTRSCVHPNLSDTRLSSAVHLRTHLPLMTRSSPLHSPARTAAAAAAARLGCCQLWTAP